MRKKLPIILNCKYCDAQFTVIPSRKDTAKYCSVDCRGAGCRGKPAWNSGKTYEECYGVERATIIRSTVVRSGELNGMFGKSHTDDAKQSMSDKRKGKPAYNKGKKYPGLFEHRNQWGENNPSVKKILRDENITYDQYLARYEERITYKKLVTSITNQQPLYILDNYDKRGSYKVSGSYHLDHIYPISKGFENKIPPELIGNILNLQFIPWEENLKKNNKIFDDYEYSIFY